MEGENEDEGSGRAVSFKSQKSSLKNGSVPVWKCKGLAKTVCFADMKGQQLVDVRNFIPSCESLCSSEPNSDNKASNSVIKNISIPTLLNQPLSDVKWVSYINIPSPESDVFKKLLEQRKVLLEEVEIIESINDSSQLLKGLVRVLNLSFEKKVVLRGTYQNWATYFENQSTFKDHFESSNTDTFSFEFALRGDVILDTKYMEFAVCYICNGCSYWDNNNSINYKIYQI